MDYAALLLAIITFASGAALSSPAVFQNPEFLGAHRHKFALASALDSRQFRNSGISTSRYDSLRFNVTDITYRSVALSHNGSDNQHTLMHVNCPACDLARMEMMEPGEMGNLIFVEAARVWLFNHRQYIEPRTVRDYEQYIKALNQFFRDVPLRQIHIGHIRVYQRSRRVKAGASRINMEMSTLQQVLKDAHLWQPLASLYRPLPTKKEGSGRAYTPEQKQAMLTEAFKVKRWTLAGHILRVMFNTGTGFGELRGIRRKDFDVDHRLIYVLTGAKNPDRRRRIPLNAEAYESMCWILERWRKNGGNSSDQFLLYLRAENQNVPPRFYEPMTCPKNAFGKIKEAAKIPKEMRMYDCRVTAITETLASGRVSIHTAKKLFGHVSEEMQKRYYKPDMDTLRDAVTELERKPPKNVERVRTSMYGWTSGTV